MTDEQKIDHIENSFRHYNLGDIKKTKDMNLILASFILCGCFIEQLSGYRYALTGKGKGKKMFECFVTDYLKSIDGRYDAKKLREDLRNKLVHNYSIGNAYSLTMRASEYHLQTHDKGRVFLNLENFIADIEAAFNRWTIDVRSDTAVKQNALSWFKEHNILAQVY